MDLQILEINIKTEIIKASILHKEPRKCYDENTGCDLEIFKIDHFLTKKDLNPEVLLREQKTFELKILKRYIKCRNSKTG